MIIIDICGGLGNQMFQYALYCELLMKGKDVKLSLRHFEDIEKGKWRNIPQHGKKFLLNEIFNIEYQLATRKETKKLGSIGTDFMSRFIYKLGYRKKTHIKEDMLMPISKQKLIEIEDAFLEGYWQDFSLFDDAYDMIRSQLKFTKKLNDKNYNMVKQIESTESVSIHVRRGDYLKSSLYAKLDEDYYLNAIRYIKKHIDNTVFYCFSDDIEWCRELFSRYNVTYIDWNKGEDSYIDMQLMSLCKHNIIANSSFSVWAAWLNTNKKKYVIRPKMYYADAHKSEKYPWPKEWHQC